MSAHTPGPWEAVSPIRAIGITGGPDGRFICHIAGTSEFGVLRSAEADANARLIAAAPDLLAICKSLAATTSVPKYLRTELDTAIPKAEGER